MADKKVTELTALTNVSGDDLLLVIDDPLGTPASKKITINRLFANVVSGTTHKGITNFRANTGFTGATMTVSANLVYQGTEIDNKYSSWSALTSTNTEIRTLVSDRMQVANVQSYIANTNAWLTASNTAIDDRMQVANTIDTFTSTTQSIVSSLFVNSANTTANAGVFLSESNITVFTTPLSPASITLFSTAIGANAAAAYSTRVASQPNGSLANNVVVTLPASNGTLALVNDATQSLIARDITANTVTVQANTGLVVAVSTAPSSNNPSTEGWTAGTIAFSNTYLYIAVDGNSIKRVPLEVF